LTPPDPPHDDAVVTTRIGLIVPCDLTLDREYWELIPRDVSVHITRTGFHEGALDLAFVRGVSDLGEVAYATRSLSKIEPAVIAFACTSGSFIDGLAGEMAIRDTMLGNGAREAVTTSGALIEALHELGVTRVALGTPYIAEIGDRLPAFVTEAGFEPVSVAHLELPDVFHDLADDAVRELAQAAWSPGAEAVFLACTGVPTVHLLDELRARLGVPVLSANQVTIWAALRRAGLDVDLMTGAARDVGTV
jgi:maleate isomerase